ncbi:MAG: DUF167 domain-containing protein [Chloroflexi bacterium]|nr:DUF167 domain-containing protein [Chloroflexota bacterium]
MPTRISAHVQPKARKREIVRLGDGTLRIKVTAAAEDGKANQAVCDLLAEALGVAKRAVSVVSGHRNRNKVLEIDLTADELVNRLANLGDLE